MSDPVAPRERDASTPRERRRSRSPGTRRAGLAAALGGVVLLSAACTDEPGRVTGTGEPPVTSGGECSIPEDLIFDGGVGRDGIPALSNPQFVDAASPGAAYLGNDDRVIVVVMDDEVYAVPHNILWRHEIVNLDRGAEQVAVTYCPLTGSSMVFDRTSVDGAEFGVSGLLFQNNLVMYDRSTDESLWPQMMRQSRCGVRDGQTLAMRQSVEMTWGRFKELHPAGTVIPSLTVDPQRYQVYPYGDYEVVDNPRTLFPQEIVDRRRRPKERVLGIPDGAGGGRAYPFPSLREQGSVVAVNDAVGGRRVVVLWDGAGEAAYAYDPTANGVELTLVVATGMHGGPVIEDTQTGTRWAWDGRAVDGPLEGQRMEPVHEAYVAFWFAWAAFHPHTQLHGRPVDEVSFVAPGTAGGEGGFPDRDRRPGTVVPHPVRDGATAGGGGTCPERERVA